MPEFRSISDKPLAEQIQAIGKAAMAGNRVGAILKTGTEAEYKTKLLRDFPTLEVIGEIVNRPYIGVTLLVVQPKGHKPKEKLYGS